MKAFQKVSNNLFQVIRRGMHPDGGGEVFFSCPVKRSLKAMQFTTPGLVKRIRGVALVSSFLIYAFKTALSKSDAENWMILETRNKSSQIRSLLI